MRRSLFTIVAVLSLMIGIVLATFMVWNTIHVYSSYQYIQVRDYLISHHIPYHAYRLVMKGWLRTAMIEAVLAILPVLWLANFRKRRRWIRSGCCLACGYDLRATQGRCPECGTVPKPNSLPVNIGEI